MNVSLRSCCNARRNSVASRDSMGVPFTLICFFFCAILSFALVGFAPQIASAETNDANTEAGITTAANDTAVYDIQDSYANHSFYNGQYIAQFKFKITKATKVELTFSFTSRNSRIGSFALYKGDSEFVNLGMVMNSSASYSNGGYTNTSDNVVAKGNGFWTYTATLEPGDYYVRASVLSVYANEFGNSAWVKMQTVANTNQSSSGSTASNANNSANNSGNTSGTTSGTQTSTSSAGKWIYGSKGWWYSYSDGSYAKGLKNINGKTYYFDNNGWMKTGWQHAKGNSDWYYFNGSGAMQTSWKKLSGKWYYMNSDGKMLTGKQTVNKKIYFLAGSGAMRTGWVKDDGNWYYCNSSGAATIGWQKVKGTWYYMNSDYTMATGWVNDGKANYYMKSSGAMTTGWKKIGSYWYYFTSSGSMKTNAWISNKFWVGSDGIMATNSWVDNGKYYVDGDGAWVKGKKPSASNNAATVVTADSITIPQWYEMTAISTSGANGLTPVLDPSSKNSVSFYEDGTYNLRLTSNGELDTYPGSWDYDYTENGKRYYWLNYNGSKFYRASLSSSGTLILMMVKDTDYVLCFEPKK